MSKNIKRALIFGVSGQDGTYLSKFLIDKGYEVFGTSRDVENSSFENLKKINIKIKTYSVAINDYMSVLNVIKSVNPNEIYNLACQSSVSLSFSQPKETIESISIGTLNILEAIRFLDNSIKFYSAGSSECYGNTKNPINETDSFNPRSPYGVAKAAAFWQVSNYREAYNIFACTGILFNHESPLRKERFVTKKIIKTAYRISRGENIKLELGNIKIKRDWGWAPEYVEAMWLMLQEEKPQDFVIATGKTISLEDFVMLTFEFLNLNWKDHIILNDAYLRPTDILAGYANPLKAKKILGWQAKYKVEDVIKMLIEEEAYDYNKNK
jgi:GDPmannose 4,6-dehydratase